jgi:hypothetical protein
MATGLPYWDDDPEAWDTLILGKVTMPGVWEVEDGDVKRMLEIKKAPGRDGATVKDQGYENGTFRIMGQICGAEMFAQLQAALVTLKATTKGKVRPPVEIRHPQLLLLGITQVNIVKIDVLRRDNGIGTQTITVLEYIPKPKNAGTKKPSSSPSLASEFVDEDFNAITAGQRLKQQEAAAEAEAARDASRWPNFKSVSPTYSPLAP